MEDKDFRVGDKVQDILIGNGIVKATNLQSPLVRVDFNNGKKLFYYKDGRYVKDNKHPILYHGWGELKITGEIIQVRKVTKYANIYYDFKTGESKTCLYSRKRMAENGSSKSMFYKKLIATAIPVEVEEEKNNER